MDTSPNIIAFDLGTGGCKASLFNIKGQCLAEHFVSISTHHPKPQQREQRPEDWWNAVVKSTAALRSELPEEMDRVTGLSLSGHSLACVPMDQHGKILREYIPIWSDTRPESQQLDAFFSHVSTSDWYNMTGNGFPPALYTIFKLMWLRDHEPDVFQNTSQVLGTKDYINFRLTGKWLTDPSYASGTGVYDLNKGDYSSILLKAAGIDRDLLPPIVPSTQNIGTLHAEAAQTLQMPSTVSVICGGVDNACMALGAKAFKPGRLYNSLGTSSWIAVASEKPVLDSNTKPYVFAHVVPNMYVSANAIFSAGNSFRWVRDQLCQDLISAEQQGGSNAYNVMTALAADVPAGSRGLLFNPSLAGGSSLDETPELRGAFSGLDLGHTRADLIRATMEGVAMGLKVALDALAKLTSIGDTMLVVGGGAQSELWRQIYADVYGMDVVQTQIDEQAGTLGAAACAFVGLGLWDDFAPLDELHQEKSRHTCNPQHRKVYERQHVVFQKLAHFQCELATLKTSNASSF